MSRVLSLRALATNPLSHYVCLWLKRRTCIVLVRLLFVTDEAVARLRVSVFASAVETNL